MRLLLIRFTSPELLQRFFNLLVRPLPCPLLQPNPLLNSARRPSSPPPLHRKAALLALLSSRARGSAEPPPPPQSMRRHEASWVVVATPKYGTCVTLGCATVALS
jgi:hypothetical protein